jgi:uncharacterized coiled-coil protein SlyX
MKISLRRLMQGMPILVMLTTLNACSLLTVERIVDQRPLETDAHQLVTTLSALEDQLAQQDEFIEYLATQVSALATEIVQQNTSISYLATRGPAPSTSTVNLPPSIVPVIVGGVEIEGGTCCVGGIAGEEINIRVRFTAIGLEYPTTEMRYLTGAYGLLDDQLDAAPWEPYVEVLTFSYQIPTNWTGFYVRVQYRDSFGNLSPIYTDDISVEGMPPLTPSPGG